ncbi:hypothetical protein BDV24DRAFT_133345 [Aspergillus arachidicola]|uniref:Uncharacterized protein n=1 Tax=Aspergillus arachidicola TaxID=656916 RepID=A0A5N6Y8G1_9EURO|nr:hypothetical protein BDV24DRAFT_133345 [Aspergillus arachidicola]
MRTFDGWVSPHHALTAYVAGACHYTSAFSNAKRIISAIPPSGQSSGHKYCT